MAKEYTDLSNFTTTFNPLTQPDKRWKQIFEDEYARVIFVGFKIQHIVSERGLDVLMQEALSISDDIRDKKLNLEYEVLKIRLKNMHKRMYGGGPAMDNDINDDFIKHLLPYLKGKKSFGYEIKSF